MIFRDFSGFFKIFQERHRTKGKLQERHRTGARASFKSRFWFKIPLQPRREALRPVHFGPNLPHLANSLALILRACVRACVRACERGETISRLALSAKGFPQPPIIRKLGCFLIYFINRLHL